MNKLKKLRKKNLRNKRIKTKIAKLINKMIKSRMNKQLNNLPKIKKTKVNQENWDHSPMSLIYLNGKRKIELNLLIKFILSREDMDNWNKL